MRRRENVGPKRERHGLRARHAFAEEGKGTERFQSREHTPNAISLLFSSPPPPFSAREKQSRAELG